MKILPRFARSLEAILKQAERLIINDRYLGLARKTQGGEVFAVFRDYGVLANYYGFFGQIVSLNRNDLEAAAKAHPGHDGYGRALSDMRDPSKLAAAPLMQQLLAAADSGQSCQP